MWVVAGWVMALVAVRVWTSRQPPGEDVDDEPADIPVVPPVSWSPYDVPMGPVSSWPHAVDRPESVPSGSPADRSFPE